MNVLNTMPSAPPIKSNYNQEFKNYNSFLARKRLRAKSEIIPSAPPADFISKDIKDTSYYMNNKIVSIPGYIREVKKVDNGCCVIS